MWRKWRTTMPRVDIPELTRCCFCIPLRYGLIAWGYFKLVLLSFLAYTLIADLIRFSRPHPMLIIIILVTCTDIVFDLVFIVAGHMKHKLLYWVYFYYSICLMCIYSIFWISFICWNWYGLNHFSVALVLRITLELITTFLPIFSIQCYVTLLVRTEARKLANGSNFEFVNNAAESTCSMDLAGSNNIHANSAPVV